jgi:hypothetical protein
MSKKRQLDEENESQGSTKKAKIDDDSSKEIEFLEIINKGQKDKLVKLIDRNVFLLNEMKKIHTNNKWLRLTVLLMSKRIKERKNISAISAINKELIDHQTKFMNFIQFAGKPYDCEYVLSNIGFQV